jgi:cephalosporin hydroxylase
MKPITLQGLLELGPLALQEKPLQGPQWPPSVYYRYIGLLTKRMDPTVFVELGTCGGGASRSAAIYNQKTLVVSIDISARLSQVPAIERSCPNFKFVRGDSTTLPDATKEEHHAFSLTLGMAEGEIAQDWEIIQTVKGKIGILFIDTVHTYEHTMKEFAAWKPYLAPGAVVLLDDLNREGMDRVWRELPGQKTEFSALAKMHVGGSPTDGGFGALIL